jgi:hypothetical protein
MKTWHVVVGGIILGFVVCWAYNKWFVVPVEPGQTNLSVNVGNMGSTIEST